MDLNRISAIQANTSISLGLSMTTGLWCSCVRVRMVQLRMRLRILVLGFASKRENVQCNSASNSLTFGIKYYWNETNNNQILHPL